MSRLEELIKELCPNGVESDLLKNVSIMQRGTSLTKKNATKGEIPVVSGGKEPAFYCDTYNRKGETITVAGSGAGAGYVQYWNEPIFVSDAFSIKGNEKTMTKYLYYYLEGKQEYIYSTQKGGGVPHVHISSIDSMQVPVPPLEVQREIVRILDSFTLLTAELTAELTARKKQYEFYRDELLKLNNIEKKKISDISIISRGTRVVRSELDTENGFPVFQNSLIPMGYFNKANRQPHTTFVISAGAAGDVGYCDEDYWAADDCLTFDCSKEVNDRFLFHFLKTRQVYLYSRVRKASVPRLSREVLEKLEIPVPPLEIQEKIVEVLDNFDSICADLNIGLPAEIEARQKQYEYYRDALLTFAETGTMFATHTHTR